VTSRLKAEGLRKSLGGAALRSARCELGDPAEALATDVALTEQELSPIPQSTVVEIAFLGREPAVRPGGVDFSRMNAASQAILADVGFANPAMLVA
jgi:putative xylitol transport system ATP-binding protein